MRQIIYRNSANLFPCETPLTMLTSMSPLGEETIAFVFV